MFCHFFSGSVGKYYGLQILLCDLLLSNTHSARRMIFQPNFTYDKQSCFGTPKALKMEASDSFEMSGNTSPVILIFV